MGPNGTNRTKKDQWDQMEPNCGTKWDQMGPNGTKWDQMGPSGTKWELVENVTKIG